MGGGNKSPLVPSPAPLKGKPAPAKTAIAPVALVYNVYIYNALSIIPDQTLNASVQSAATAMIQGFFDQIIAARQSMTGTKFSAANVQWIPTSGPYPTIAAYELLCYVLPYGRAIVTTHTLIKGPPPADHKGLTQVGSDGTSGSEAYISPSSSVAQVADIIFHEMMHNKQNMDNSMHSQDGLAVASITWGDPISASNIQVMAAALPNRHPQWTGGLAILASELTRNPNDPLSGM
jgi:hypothetical protein